MEWAKRRLRQMNQRREVEHRNQLLQAKARMKVILHWRPMCYGTKQALPPSGFMPQQPVHPPIAAACNGVKIVQQQPVLWTSPHAVQTAGGYGIQWPGHLQQLALPPGPSSGTVRYAGTTLRLGGANYQPSLAPIPQGGKKHSRRRSNATSRMRSSQASSSRRRSSQASSSGRRSSLASTSSMSSSDVEGSGNESSGGSSSSSSNGASDCWRGWPEYALRVGITIVEKLPCDEGDLSTRFYVACTVLPVVDANCKEVTEKKKDATTKTSRKRYPMTEKKAAHIRRVSQLMQKDDYLTRKIGLLLQRGVAIDTIADVLDVDNATVHKYKEEALIEMTGRRDVIFDEAFVYYIRDPLAAEVRLEVFQEVPKKEPESMGWVNLKVGALLYREEMEEELMRLSLHRVDKNAVEALQAASAAPSNGPVPDVKDTTNVPHIKDRFAKISAACQLWPIVTRCEPHASRLGKAASAEDSSSQDMGQKMVTAVFVYSASDLRNVDMFGGKSDPYCICSLETGNKSAKQFQTQVIDNDPDPVWNHAPQEVKWGAEKLMRFTVYDKDFCRKGDMLGEVAVTREQCRQGLFTELSLGDGNGTIRVKIAPMNAETMMDVPFSKPRPVPRISVYIKKAENLRCSNGKGDSTVYVVCTISQEQTFRTNSHSISDPRWDHQQVLTLGDYPEVQFQVKADGRLGSSKLGTATLSRELCLKGYEGALALEKSRGLLHVKVEHQQQLDLAFATHLNVCVLSAKDLRNADFFGGTSDPYVICKLKGKEKFKTKVVWNNVNPIWNHGPEDVVLRQEKELQFEVYDKDVVGNGDFLGRASVDRDICLKGFDGHLDLGKGNGTLHVRIRLADDTEAGGLGVPDEPSGPENPPDALVVWLDVARGVASRMFSLMMKHLPKCGG